MKQLLFLLLFPCLCMAQYTGNAGQKITLGEQTTADGLVYRGNAAADTTRKPSVDTMAFILLDTNTNIIWQYKKATNNAWTRVGGSISSGLTGVLPVANGGTGENMSGLPNNYLIRKNSSGIFDTAAIFEADGNVGIGLNSPVGKFNINTGATGISVNVLNQANGTISFANGSGGTAVPNILGKSTNNVGLTFRAITPNIPAAGIDMQFIVNETDDSDYATLTSSAFRFLRHTTVIFNILRNGNIGIGTSSPTAVLHLKAGTATAAPIRLTSSGATLLSSLESGAMEFNGTNLLFTPSTTRHTVNHGLTGSATLNFPSTTTLLSADLTIAVTGAADGDVVSLGVPNAAVNANTCYTAWVSAANTVTVRFNNYSSGTVDPASGLFKVFVTK